MERQAMWMFSALFFGSLPVAALLIIVSIFSPSAGVAKAAGLFSVLLVAGLFGMIGSNMLARFSVLKRMDGPPQSDRLVP